MVPFFWTKHFDLSIRYVGHAEKWDEILVEGDLVHGDGLVRFRCTGHDLAVASIERDEQSLCTELAMESEFRRPLCTSRPQSSSACGIGRLASRKATHDRGQRSSGVRRGYFPFRRTRFDPQATVAGVAPVKSGKRRLRAPAIMMRMALFQAADVDALHESGLLTAVLPVKCGGAGLSGLCLSEVLQSIGSGSLPLGRLFEGHVNALELVLRYGNHEQVELVAEEARAGKLFGVWNTDDANGLRLIHRHGRSWLEGRKILASGAGHIERPLVTATDENGRRLMVLPKLGAPDRADLSGWTAQGMRASATGAVDFTGVEIEPIEIVGREGDYERQPWFSAGAWRFAAVHLGGMERLFDLLRRHLQETNRGQDPHQAARLGRAAMAVETARLWVAQAAINHGSSSGIESAGAACRLRQSRAPWRWRRRLSISCSLSSAQSGFRLSCDRIRSSAYRGTLQPIFASQARIARLTDAAAWILAQPVGAQDLWR